MKLNQKTLDAALKGSTSLKAGRHSDGRNLYLNVTKTGAMSWIFMWDHNGKRREMGLGSFTGAGKAARVTLAQARLKADAVRLGLAMPGADPLAEKQQAKVATATFAEMFRLTVERQKGDPSKSGWKVKNGVCGQEKDWTQKMNLHAKALMAMPLNRVRDQDVFDVLSPIWGAIEVTADRVRFIMEKVFDTAIAKGAYKGLNPARYEGHTEIHVGKRSSGEAKKQPSLDYAKVPAFMATILSHPGMASKAVAFATLTAVRTDEARLMKWSEVDLDARLWIVPSERMKVKKANDRGGDHLVPLSDAAVALLGSMPREVGNDYVFFGKKAGMPIGPTALNDKVTDPKAEGGMDLKGEATMHGMRASFRTWATENGLSHDAAELCLAHVVGTKTQRSYNRAEMIEERTKVMRAWGNYCEGKSNVHAVNFAMAS
jgi:integrase